MEQFAQLYDELITLLSSQCHTAKAFLELEMKDVEEEKTIMLALIQLNTMSVAFSEVIKLFQIAATIPVSTASREQARDFSPF